MPLDRFPADTTLEGPANGAAVVTPHDVNEFAYTSRALYVGGAGNVSVTMRDGQTVVFQNVQAGSILPLRANRVNATNTTATNIVAMY